LSRFDPSLQLVKRSSERLLPSRAFVELIDAVLVKGADFRLRAKGLSMYPFIQEGDIVTLAACEADKIRRGDVVALPHPTYGNLIIHRVIKVEPTRIKTKGDYNPVSDGWVDREHVLALVVRVQRQHRDVKKAPVFVQQTIAFLSRFLHKTRIRFRVFKTILIAGECF
jgi:signal peptidase I